jgi:chloramphenicol O-acetyltransferase type A
MKEINIEKWERKIQYNFFKTYDDPFFNITANLEVTNLYNYCKTHKLSFFLSGLFIAVKALNKISAFKLRLKDDKVYEFDTVHIDSTILNEDNTFSFCHFPYKSDIFEFVANGGENIKNHKKGMVFDSKENDLDTIHSTTIPWVSLTSFKHARNGKEKKIGIPKIVFGKYFDENNIKKMPFSVEVHHALMDGIHVGLLFEKMQQLIDELV